MVVYHLVPTEELQLHDFTVECLCDPKLAGKDDDKFWLSVILGEQLYRHHYFSPLGQEPCADVVAVGEEIADEPAWK